MANATQERYQTGKQARDEQSPEVLQANRQLNENWQETRAELKKNFSALTNEDLEMQPGHEQETIDRIGKRLKKTPDETGKLVRDTSKRFQNMAGHSTTERTKSNARLQEAWPQTRNELKKNFSKLTEEDLELKPGHEQETFDRIGKRLNRTVEEAVQLVRDTAKHFQSPTDAAGKPKMTA